MKLYLLIALNLIPSLLFAQSDSVKSQNFIRLQTPEELKFISFLRSNQVDSCLSRISTETIQKIGTKQIKEDLNKIAILYKKYGNPKYQWTLGHGYKAIGFFGHDVRGTIEKQCEYVFQNKSGEIIYKFILYYWDYKNYGIIKYFEIYDIEGKKKVILDAPPI